jgi:hypothetical protein
MGTKKTTLHMVLFQVFNYNVWIYSTVHVQQIGI